MSTAAHLAALLLAVLAVLASAPALASSRYCDARNPLSATQQDRLLRVAAVLKAELEATGSRVALVARSGLDLRRFGMRYSHAGISLQRSAETPWAVRQLYFACDEAQPRLFDEGLSAFVMGTEDPALGFMSLVLLPADAAERLESTALDNASALALLNPVYSANAYAYGLRYQNCNQWLAELLGVAFGGAPASRDTAQAWLRSQGYEGAVFDLGWSGFTWLTVFSPFLHRGDHPGADLAAGRFVVSMPESIGTFVRRLHPQVTRVELCHTDRHVVVRRGWDAPLPDDCTPGEGDRVVALD